MSGIEDMKKALEYVSEKHHEGLLIGGIVSQENIRIVGEGGGCDLIALPNGATVIQIDLSCDGPDCQANEFYVQGVWYHLFVVPGRITSRAHRFCSLRCMANWLAGELAKEESK